MSWGERPDSRVHLPALAQDSGRQSWVGVGKQGPGPVLGAAGLSRGECRGSGLQGRGVGWGGGAWAGAAEGVGDRRGGDMKGGQLQSVLLGP